MTGPADSERLTSLAERLDCFTEVDFRLLTDATPSTVEAWRKRGEGPAYIRAGNRYFYPCESVAEWMRSRLHQRTPLKGKTL